MTRAAWITGAGKGIGRSLALRLAADGWRVAVSARTEADLLSLAAEGQGLDGAIFPYALDVTDEAEVAHVLDAIEDGLGPLDLAVLNAGTHIPVAAEELSSEPFRKLMEVNFFGVVYGLAAVLPRMIRRGGGQVAVVASVSGYRGLPTAAAYGATKAALINMCEALKPELDRSGVRLSLINPGFVQTPLTDRNDFPMPFLISAEKAADRIVRGLERGAFEITFPRRFSFLLKLARCLPYGLYFRLVGRMARQ